MAQDMAENANRANSVYRNWRGPKHGVVDINVRSQINHICEKGSPVSMYHRP